MANFPKSTLRALDHQRHDLTDRLAGPLAELREEIAALAESLAHTGIKRLTKAQHEADALTQAAREHMPVLAREVSHHAQRASRSLRKDPVPAVVLVGTVALLASLVWHETRR